MRYSREVFGFLAVAVVFVLVSLYVRSHADTVASLATYGGWGMLTYWIFACVATVIAPISTLPLVPVAVTLWGPFVTTVINITGWFTGSLVAFGIARRWGKPVVKRLIHIDTITRYERMLGKTQLFWNIVLLRMALPVDVLSYILGMMSSVSWKTYSLATLLGITPFAIIFSYTAESFVLVQIIVFVILTLLFTWAYYTMRRKHKEGL